MTIGILVFAVSVYSWLVGKPTEQRCSFTNQSTEAIFGDASTSFI